MKKNKLRIKIISIDMPENLHNIKINGNVTSEQRDKIIFLIYELNIHTNVTMISKDTRDNSY